MLLGAKVAISMDGFGRAIDNVFIDYYNEDRPHSSLDDATHDEVYYQSRLQQRAA